MKKILLLAALLGSTSLASIATEKPATGKPITDNPVAKTARSNSSKSIGKIKPSALPEYYCGDGPLSCGGSVTACGYSVQEVYETLDFYESVVCHPFG